MQRARAKQKAMQTAREKAADEGGGAEGSQPRAANAETAARSGRSAELSERPWLPQLLPPQGPLVPQRPRIL